MSFYKYTPALLEPKILEDTLIGRDIELDNLKRILKSASSGRSISHAILIGPKGIGKTHVLQILYHAVRGDIKTKNIHIYKKKFIPVIFPEEEFYGNIIKFIMWTLRYLAESKTKGIPLISKELITPVILDNKQRELALSYLKTFKKKTGKILLLLVDNLNDIIERFTDEDQSSLREVLMTYDSILLIGSAPTLFDSIVNHDRPLYNFFEVIWLKDLPFEESVALLKRYAEIEGKNELIEKFKKSEPKLRAIHELAGGNPRLILSLYHIIVEGDIISVETTFLKLLDDLSPYFSLRMKDLSAQQSEIIDVIASAEKLLTPTEISARCYMPVNIVNSQLKRLEKIGYVSKLPKKYVKRVLYDLNEKLFRLWRQMRVEAGRRRFGFIVKFLEIWFTKEELIKYLDIIFKEIRERITTKEEIQIQPYMDKIWYIKEAIPEFRDDDEVCVACQCKDFHSALTIIQESLKSRPKDAKLLTKLGCINRLLGNYDEAIEACKKAVEIKSDFYGAWYNLGNTYVKLENYDEAIEAYNKAIEIKPDSHGAWNDLGTTYGKLKNYDEAIKVFKKAIEIKPDSHEAWYNLGTTYVKLKNYDEAIKAYKKAIDIEPDYYEGINSLGNIYVELKNYDEAIKVYKKAIEIKSDFYGAWYNLGNIYGKLKNYDEAIEAYNKAIEIKPDYYEAWNNIGNVYDNLKRYRKAIDVFKKAIKINIDRYEAWANIGRAYLHLGAYEKAIEAGKNAIKIKPGNDYLLYSLLNIFMTIFGEEGDKGNISLSINNLRETLTYFNNLRDKKEGASIFISAFKHIIRGKNTELLKMALNEIKTTSLPELLEALSPYFTFVKYLETKDREIIERLRHEERIVVEDMIRMVEGETKEKLKQKKSKINTRKKNK